MAKKKQLPAVLKTFDDLDAAGIGIGWKSPFTAEVTPTPKAPKSGSLMSGANDMVIELANAAAGGVKSAADFVKPGNAVSGWIDKNIIKAGEDSQSDSAKAWKQQLSNEVDQADGAMGELSAVGNYLTSAPHLAVAQALGSFVVPGAAIKGAGMAGRAAGLGAKGVQVSGRAGGVAAGAALAGGDAAGTAYELSTKAGATEDEAVSAARGASVIPALVGAAGGAFGAESLLAGAKGFGGGVAARAAKTGLSEAAQEAVEEGVTQYEGQRAAMPFDASIDPSKGVAAAAGMGAALGGMTGAGTSLLVGDRGREAPTALDAALAADDGGLLSTPTVEQDQGALGPAASSNPSPEQLALLEQLQADRSGANNVSPILDMDTLQRQGVTPAGVLDERALAREGLGGPTAVMPAAPVPVVPERGALSRAANLAAASAPPAIAPLTDAVQAQAQGQPAMAAQNADDETGEISPEERVGQIEDRLDYLAQMGRAQGWSPEAVAQRSALQQELDLLSPAQRMDDLQAQADAAEARAADWAGREYRPNPMELPAHAAQGGPVDIQEANEQRRLKSINQAQQEAAAARDQAQQLENEGNAQAQLAAQQDRAARLDPEISAEAPNPSTMDAGAGEQADLQASPVPEAQAPAAPDILNRLGKPFTVKLAANKAAKEAGAGWEPVKVEGGFVVRQVQPSASISAAAPAAPAAQQAVAQGEEVGSESSAQDQVPAAPQEPGARWDGMAPEAQRAVLAAAPNLVPVLRKNLEGKAWEKISEGNRAKLSSAMTAQQAMTGPQGPSTALAPSSFQEELGEGVGTFSEKLAAKINDARYKLAQGESIAPAMRKINGADVPAMTTEVQRLESLREEAKALDATAQRDDTARGMLKAARQELDASALNATARTEAVARAGATGSAVDASQAIFDAVDSKTTPVPVEGEDLGNGWAAFAPESGTKGIPRAEMPQIKAEHRGAMVNFMNARGIAHQEETVPAASLKPTQAEFDRAKVQKAIGFQGGDRSILVSQDGHVLDGHHQWLAAREQGKDVKTIRLDAPIEQLLEKAREFPSSTTSAGAVPGLDVQAFSSRPVPAQVSAPRAGQDPAPASVEKPKPAGPIDGPAFKKWFGESKAVSDEGKPMVMYHGTSASEDGQAFGMFDTYASNYGLMGMGGYFTADPDVASNYTSKGKGTTPTVYPVYLSVKNPLDMDAKATPDAWRKQFPDAASFHEGGDTNESWYRAAEEALSQEGLPKWEGAEAMQDGLRAMGFDGITHVGGGRVKSAGVKHRVYIAFDPEQIKSATGNNGEFDGGNPDIRFRRADQEGGKGAAGPGMTPEQAEQLLRIMGQAPQQSRAAQARAVSTVRATADGIRAGWANGPEVIVVHDMSDLAIPAAARRADQAQRSGGAEGDPEGFYYGGKVYLLASQLPTQQDAARVLMHEALGHHGLLGAFGSGLDGVLQQIVAVRRGDVRRKAAEYGLDYEKPAQRLQAAEEVLAEWAQTRPEMGFVRRAVAAIRTWLRQHVPGLKRLAVTDAEIIRSYILPARGWVERGAGAGMGRGLAFSRATGSTNIPDSIIGSTLGAASSHPDYASAKGGDIEAAVRLAQDLVTPELEAKVRAAIGDAKPRVVPVAAEEAAGRNKIPRAAAEVLAMRLGLETASGIVQANRARRTGLDGLDRIFAPVDFAGTVEPGPYLLVDDTLTQGGTFAALASHIREGGGTVAGVIALTGKQYSATIQPSSETLTALRQKHGDLENEFRAATGYGFDALTQSEARYLARYEPADRLRDRILAEGRRGRQREDQGDSGSGAVSDGPVFSRSSLATLKNSALDQLGQALSHPGKVTLWDKTVGTMRHLAERSPVFRPVYESAQRNIDDVSMLANDAADRAPRILPRVESMGDIVGKNRKRPVSAEDNKAVARPLFEGTLLYGRDVDGKPALVDDLAKKYANMAVYNKAALLLRTKKLDSGVLAMWQGLPVQQYEKLIESRFQSKIVKAGVVWSDAELKAMFSASPNQISLYREARAAVDRSIDLTARTDMLRALGDEYSGMRDIVLDQADLAGAAQLLLDTLEQDAKAVPDNRDRISELMQQVRRRLDTATDLQQAGYAPLSRFGQYTVDVVDAAGERQYFGMYETMRESNMAARNFRQTFPGAAVTQGTMSQQTFKLFAGVSPETLEHFGEMLGLKSQGNDAQDKAFQAYLQLTKNNHSALKRLIHRKGTAGYSTDVGRVVANFVYSNARAGALGLNAGTLDKAIQAIPQGQGEIRDLAMGLRSYIQDPQEEGQAVRGMLFAQYLGGSVASAFVNMTQPFQVTLPWLSQHGGMKKAGAQLARALKDMGTKGFQYETELAKALKSAEDDGVVSPQEIHQLMAQSRGAGGLRAGDGTAAGNARAAAGNAWERTKVAWGQPFALAEQFNRRSTFIASYRLAKQQGIQNPAAFARHAVLETQFVYSKANKPQWARGTIGGTLFTFKTYSVSYLELMQRMWTQGGPEGRRAVGWSLAMLMLMSGAGGLPFVEDVEDLIDAGGQMMGYSMSTKQWRKQFLQDRVGKEFADFMEQGISGLPGAPIDISGRLGMGNLLPGTGLFLEKRDHTRDVVEVIGPAGDLLQRGASGLLDIAKGVFSGDVASIGRGALEMAPTAVRNLAKGVDMANSGVYKDSKGRKVIDVTLAEAVAKAIGFQPKSVAEVQEATGTEQNLIGQNRAMKERLTADMAQAVYDQDAEKQSEIRERMRTWNSRNPESPVFIDRRAVRSRVIKMRQTKAERVAAAAPKSIRASVRQSLTEAQAASAAP
ncbi:PLxRFG domain-containing protein [Pantoea sp. 18069]|uniref:PLxRFG domain-containing protein n=1 Tax=Pantoea sp. 18069 TaxID=2681415 RepID=UPI001356A2FC|nr:PLxRFG domain-containing protein [Pantoea sp. 18069]